MSTGRAAAVERGHRPPLAAASKSARARGSWPRPPHLWLALVLLLWSPLCVSSRRGGGYDPHSPIVPSTPHQCEQDRRLPPTDAEYGRKGPFSRPRFGLFRRRPREEQQSVEAVEARRRDLHYHYHHREADEALEREQEQRRREHHRYYGGRMVNVASAQASMVEAKPRQQQPPPQQQEEEQGAAAGAAGGEEDWTFSRFRAQIRKEVEEESRRQEQQEEERRKRLRSGYLTPPPATTKPSSTEAEEKEGAGPSKGGPSKRQAAPAAESDGEQLAMTAEERKEATQALIHMKVHHQLHNQAMLYVACTVNDRGVRACVDTGASTTVMSLKMARECGLMPHVDRSVVGAVQGVGFAKILGCVHDARIRLGRMEVRTRVSIIDCLSPPFVIGLDVLRHCKCDVSFRENVLILRNEDGQTEVLPLYHGHHSDADDAPQLLPPAPRQPAAVASAAPPAAAGGRRPSAPAPASGAAGKVVVEDEDEDEDDDGGGPAMGVSMAGV